MICDCSEHFEELRRLSGMSDTILISTFGLYVGVLDNGEAIGLRTYNRAFDWLESIRDSHKVHIIVGIPSIMYCDEDKKCEDCLKKHVSYCDRLACSAQYWPEFDWRFTHDHHAKYFCFIKSNRVVGAIAGSRNLGDSNWEEVSFVVEREQAKLLAKRFLSTISMTSRVNKENIDSYLRSL